MRSGTASFLISLTLAHAALCQERIPGAQGETVSGAVAQVFVTSDPPGAEVLLDSLPAGTTPCTIQLPQAGTFRIKLLQTPPADWMAEAAEQLVSVRPAEVCSIHVVFRTPLLVVSSPSGAEVRLGERLLGTTPLLLREWVPRPGQLLRVTREGYEPTSVDPSLSSRNVLAVPLLARADPGAGSGLKEEVESSGLKILLAGGGAILAGGAAAYFKGLANDRNGRYLATGDPGFASERDRFDRTSGLLLFASEVSFGLFVAFLLSQ